MKPETPHLKKLTRLGIRWNLFLSFFLFSAVMIVLLWLFQIVFLDSFYRDIKTRALARSADTVVSSVNRSDLSTLLGWIRQEEEVSVRIFDEKGASIASSDALLGDIFHRLPPNELAAMRAKALAAGGSYTELYARSNPFDDPRTSDSGIIDKQKPRTTDVQDMLIAVRTVTMGNGTNATILATAMLTPVSGTVSTLRTQLIFITLIMALLSMILALLLARRIATPIVRINDRSKELAKGNYSVRFDPNGYKEVAELADTLNQAAHDLNQVETLRRDLIANVSHDLRTPLTMISGFAEVMRDLPGENTSENAQVIIDESRRLTGLVNDLLDLSKMQAANQNLTIKHYNLTESIRAMLGRYNKLVEQEGYDLGLEAGQDVHVLADESRIEQVLYNLINNAIVYAGDDKRVTVRQTIQDGQVKVEIIDHGDGIPDHQLPFIWERYYKGEKSRQRDVVGTGLGLSIVRNILDMHHAGYGVQSTLGQGSTFWFTLPVAKQP